MVRSATVASIVIALLLAAGGGCGVVPVPTPPGGAAGADQLESLPVVPRPRDDGTYRRAYFGKPWADIEHSGCRQRADVLYRDVDRSRPYTTRRSGSCSHEMVSGTWRDTYTGETSTFTNLRDSRQAQLLPIDHT